MTLLHTAAPFWDAWRTWFLSDGVGIVVVAPVVIGLGQAWREPPSRGEWIEGVGVLALLALARLYVMDQPSNTWFSFNPGFVVLPQLLWLAARCPPVFVIAGAFVASIVVICATTYGIGRFGDASVPIMERVKGAQAVVSTGTIAILVLSALFVQRKKAEEELRQRGAELGEAQRVARIGSWYWDSQSDVLIGSDEMFRIYGFDPGAPPADFRPEFGRCYAADDLERLKAAARSAMQTGVGYELDLRAFRNGTPIWLTARGEVVRNGAGQIVGLRGTVQDITDRKRAEDALAERNAQLALAGKVALVGTYAYDFDTNRMRISEGYAAIHGLPEGTTEIPHRQWRAGVHPEDLGRIEAQRDQAYRERRREYTAEYRVVRRGEVRWIEARKTISYDGDGHPQRVVGVNIDVTERKQIEQALTDRNKQLELAGKVALVGSFAIDIDVAREDFSSQRMHFSPGFGTIYGLPEETVEISVGEWRSLVHPDDLPQFLEHRQQLFAERRGEHNAEFRIVRPCGTIRWIEARSFIEYDQDGHAKRLVGVNIDITGRKQAEEQRKRLNAELDHRVKNALATVSAVVSHTKQGKSSITDFVAALEGRICSMATTHELLSSRRWEGISLAELVRRELAPYAAGNNTEIRGPEVILNPGAGQAIAMVLHELATNAAKYGALSNSGGRVSVHWDGQSNGSSSDHLVIEWREIGGPPVAALLKRGYGTSVIRNLIPYELGGTVDYALGTEGVRSTLQIPARWVSSRLST